MFDDTQAARLQALHPGIEALFGIVRVIQRIRVDEIGFSYPFFFYLVKIPLNGVWEFGGIIRDFGTNNLCVQVLTKPLLFQAPAGAVAEAKLEFGRFLL